MTSFEIEYLPKVVKNDIPRLSHADKLTIKKHIENKLTSAPQVFGKPLRHTLKGIWSLRVNDYRVIYQILKNKVIILKIGHRREVYEN
jgi:mRNA interferase RelE/StbE